LPSSAWHIIATDLRPDNFSSLNRVRLRGAEFRKTALRGGGMQRVGIVLLAGALLPGAAAGAMVATAPSAATSTARDPADAAVLPSGTALHAVLNSSLDSKKAKVGEKVEAHTTQAVTIDGRTIVPRGAQLEGHVAEATARSRGDQGSTLAIQFDKAIPRKGQDIPLNVLIMAVAPPQPQPFESAPGPGSDAMGDRGADAAGGSPMAGASRPPNPGEMPGSSVSGGTLSPEQPAERTASAGLPANARGVYGMRNLKLMETKSPQGQTTFLTSTAKEVRLDSGTRLLLLVESKGSTPGH
jgi:hypothetical protein